MLLDAIGKCMICRGDCPSAVWLCRECLDDWQELQAPFEQWPKWAKTMKAAHQGERRRELEILLHEINLPADLVELLEMWEDDGEMLTQGNSSGDDDGGAEGGGPHCEEEL